MANIIINSSLKWNQNKFAIIGALNAIRDYDKFRDNPCRRFFIFCCKQIWNLLDNDEKTFVNKVESYMNGGPEQLKDLCNESRDLVAKGIAQAAVSNLESRYTAGKTLLVAACGMCPGQNNFFLHRSMIKSAREVMFLHAVDQVKEGETFVQPTPEQTLEIGRPYAVAQVEEIKKLFLNPFSK